MNIFLLWINEDSWVIQSAKLSGFYEQAKPNLSLLDFWQIVAKEKKALKEGAICCFFTGSEHCFWANNIVVAFLSPSPPLCPGGRGGTQKRGNLRQQRGHSSTHTAGMQTFVPSHFNSQCFTCRETTRPRVCVWENTTYLLGGQELQLASGPTSPRTPPQRERERGLRILLFWSDYLWRDR